MKTKRILELEQKELCIQCGKATLYHHNTPITIRRYYVEGSGQLCPLCYQELYGVAPSLQSMYERDLGKQLNGTDSIPNKVWTSGSVQQ